MTENITHKQLVENIRDLADEIWNNFKDFARIVPVKIDRYDQRAEELSINVDNIEGAIGRNPLKGYYYKECFYKMLDNLQLDLVEFRKICLDKIDEEKRCLGRGIRGQAKALRDDANKALKELFPEPEIAGDFEKAHAPAIMPTTDNSYDQDDTTSTYPDITWNYTIT